MVITLFLILKTGTQNWTPYLTDSTYLQELKAAYESMVTVYKESGIELPKNTSIGNSTDLLIRK